MSSRLLVVEDDLSTKFAIRAFFQSAGYHVDAESDASSALSLLAAAERYDVVITDLQLRMPDAHEGMDVVSHTRRYHPHACIIMLTAFGSPATEIEARRRGVDLFSAKPVSLRDLHVFIDKVLRGDHAGTEFPVREL